MTTIQPWLATSKPHFAVNNDTGAGNGMTDEGNATVLQFEKLCVLEAQVVFAMAWMDRSKDLEDWREAVELLNPRK